MSPEDAKMAVQRQANQDFAHNYFCYDAFARNARPKPLIPRIPRGRGVPQYTANRLGVADRTVLHHFALPCTR
jgi:hypothetical protein